jgi:ParB family chromosome partitioning protein
MSDHPNTSSASSPAEEPTAPDSATDASATPDECERPWCGAASLPGSLTGRLTMPTEWLTAHPGNVRADLDLSAEFVASITENGVLVPLRVTIDGDGDQEKYRVIDGHRRLAAAVKAGLDEVPYDLVTERRGDDAGQFLDMYNAHHHRKALRPVEQADALFAAHEAGATRTRIRKSTGLKAPQVKTALTAATLDAVTRASVEGLGHERGDDMTLEDLAILAEFQDDAHALSQLMNSAAYHDSLEHQAERLRQERAERARHEKLRAELEADGLTITDSLPPGALLLTFLRHEGEQFTAESHATCPGRGAYFQNWDLETPVHYCSDPGRYGHQRPGDASPEESSGVSSASDLVSPAATGTGVPGAGPAALPAEDPEVAVARRLVIEGNRAWRAAAEVRHRWQAGQLFARRSAPREVDMFVAGQLLTMPEVLRRFLSSANLSAVFATVTGQQAAQLTESCAKAASRRLPLLMLAPIAVAYEHALTVAAGGQDTWRDNRYSPCPYGDAGAYFTFLASIGYQLSVIEQAVADGTPYTGDTPDDDTLLVRLVEPDSGEEDSEATADVPQDVPADSQDVADVHDATTSEDQAAA